MWYFVSVALANQYKDPERDPNVFDLSQRSKDNTTGKEQSFLTNGAETTRYEKKNLHTDLTDFTKINPK